MEILFAVLLVAVVIIPTWLVLRAADRRREKYQKDARERFAADHPAIADVWEHVRVRTKDIRDAWNAQDAIAENYRLVAQARVSGEQLYARMLNVPPADEWKGDNNVIEHLARLRNVDAVPQGRIMRDAIPNRWPDDEGSGP